MKKILLVDDDPFIIESTTIVLEDSGYEVSAAHNGDEALDLLASKTYDLMITDVVMPQKDGIEVLLNVKRRYPDLKVMVISGGGRLNVTNYLETAQHMDAAATLAKPFNNKDLLDKISDILKD